MPTNQLTEEQFKALFKAEINSLVVKLLGWIIGIGMVNVGGLVAAALVVSNTVQRIDDTRKSVIMDRWTGTMQVAVEQERASIWSPSHYTPIDVRQIQSKYYPQN